MTRPDLSPEDLDRPELHGTHRPVSGGLARAAVFGINDGLVSNVSLILGFAGTGVDSSVVRLAELAAMYEDHGISPDTARAAAEDVMASPEAALRVHTREELGVDPHDLPSAFNAAAISIVCFLFGALLPVIPWFTGATGFAPAAVSVAIGVVAAAFVGAAIGRFAERSIPKSVGRQVVIVLVACAVTYSIGELVGVSV